MLKNTKNIGGYMLKNTETFVSYYFPGICIVLTLITRSFLWQLYGKVVRFDL